MPGARGGGVAVDEVRFRGVAGVQLRASRTSAVLLPGLGLTGVSLRHRAGEYLAVPGGLDALRSGATSGLPLLAPWANRLSSSRYRVGRVAVDLSARTAGRASAVGRLPVDENGLPIHGLLAGHSVWTVEGSGVRRGGAWLQASIEVDSPAFPFPHCVIVTVTLRDSVLIVDTTVSATARRRVPISFGWHPYLRVPGSLRNSLRLRLPAMTRSALDEMSIPTGVRMRAPAESEVIGRRTFDDLYALGARGRALSLEGVGDAADGRSATVRCGDGYRYAQVWVPRGRPFASLEPMTAPTDALTTGDHPYAAPGEPYSARFSIELT